MDLKKGNQLGIEEFKPSMIELLSLIVVHTILFQKQTILRCLKGKLGRLSVYRDRKELSYRKKLTCKNFRTKKIIII